MNFPAFLLKWLSNEKLQVMKPGHIKLQVGDRKSYFVATGYFSISHVVYPVRICCQDHINTV